MGPSELTAVLVGRPLRTRDKEQETAVPPSPACGTLSPRRGAWEKGMPAAPSGSLAPARSALAGPSLVQIGSVVPPAFAYANPSCASQALESFRRFPIDGSPPR